MYTKQTYRIRLSLLNVDPLETLELVVDFFCIPSTETWRRLNRHIVERIEWKCPRMNVPTDKCPTNEWEWRQPDQPMNDDRWTISDHDMRRISECVRKLWILVKRWVLMKVDLYVLLNLKISVFLPWLILNDIFLHALVTQMLHILTMAIGHHFWCHKRDPPDGTNAH